MNKELQDKAWAVLPKEFREEVKKYYIECIEEMKLYTTQYNLKLHYYTLLIYLFGEHNLTSNTESTKLKLKRGDKARIIKQNHPLYGEIVLVDLVIKDAVNDKVRIKCCSGLLTFCESDLEPYSESQTNNSDENAENKKQTTVNLCASSDNGMRIMVAAEVMKGMLANTNIIMSCGDLEDNQEYITKHAVEYADALIKEINGKGGGKNG